MAGGREWEAQSARKPLLNLNFAIHETRHTPKVTPSALVAPDSDVLDGPSVASRAEQFRALPRFVDLRLHDQVCYSRLKTTDGAGSKPPPTLSRRHSLSCTTSCHIDSVRRASNVMSYKLADAERCRLDVLSTCRSG